ncbi:hypothetical protein [Mesorhizobium xinjiangense]|uniref:hypothetical protein n=1 Tax=Mesorhizobium xinjiangense TaxID=2678685 RepID=UPI0012EDE0D8|nr:hypothetical protein [Mesorhizobium xinjiangense]
MFKLVKTAALSALIGLGAIGASAAPAMADGVYFQFGSSGSHVGYYDGGRRHWDRGHRGQHRWHRGHRGDRWNRRGHDRSYCSSGRALRKAAHMGVRRAYVSRAGHRTIKVRGHARGHRVSVLFARAPHCPVIG